MGSITSFINSIWVYLTAAVICRVRLRQQDAQFLFERVQLCGREFPMIHELPKTMEIPREHKAFGTVYGLYFFLTAEERILHTGSRGVDNIVTLTIPRIQLPLLQEILGRREKQGGSVYLNSYQMSKVGRVRPLTPMAADLEAVLDPEKRVAGLREFMTEAKEVLGTKQGRASALLHGPPGVGKTYTIRTLAAQTEASISIMYFNKHMDNIDVVTAFARHAPGTIVVLEDFDRLFNKQVMLMEKSQITFDVFLSTLDGLWESLTGCVIIVTVNDLDKVDPALRSRPSRLQYVLEYRALTDEKRQAALSIMGRDATGKDEMVTIDDVLNMPKIIELGCEEEQ